MDVSEIKSLPLEIRARLKKKGSIGSLSLILLIGGLVLAIYYWFIGEFIFSYDKIKPFWGGILFIILSFLIALGLSEVFSLIYKEYNAVIDDALKEIKGILDRNEPLPSDKRTKYRAALIEPKIGTPEFSEEEFSWYNGNICWGCAQIYREAPKQYIISREKEEEWRDGVYRKSQRFQKSASVYLCPKCYQSVKESEAINRHNQHVLKIGVYVLSALLALSSWIILLINELNLTSILVGLIMALAIFGCGITIGQIITRPIAYLFTKPFRKKNPFKPYWRLDYIPQLYKFQNNRQH